MTPRELFDSVDVEPRSLHGVLNATTAAELEEQFRALFLQPEAQDAASVVYLWVTGTPIPRTKGASEIVNIGKTVNSLSARHAKYAHVEAAPGNWERYEYIIKNHGSITILFAPCTNPRELEAKLLRKYFDAHLELPPWNKSL